MTAITHEHLHAHLLEISGKLDELAINQAHIERRIKRMANELDRIESEVTDISGAVDSAIALLGKLADLIRNNAGDPVRLNKIADDLDAKGQALAAAVVANDPDTPPTT